jgi:hypothetical protein
MKFFRLGKLDIFLDKALLTERQVFIKILQVLPPIQSLSLKFTEDCKQMDMKSCLLVPGIVSAIAKNVEQSALH